MQDFINTLVLICAAIASLGLGVLLAFAVCKGAFILLRSQADVPAPVPSKAQTAEV
ncbi:hypothetical protein ACPOL_4138 [Acidisarcina polymorpha]|uniref:Uncharacterized protein n=2 Tax=Acidisarcina polymorpha TaxID=2211140 RepID=A0A2Z5G433_9BACT|nr:hypothetical protein ACPOL_4138 [Acidisarcina polymorpha]